MKKYFLITLIVAILALAAFIIWGIPYFFHTPLPAAAGTPVGTGTVKAEVIAIIEEGEIDLGGTLQHYQILRVRLLEGEYAGVPFEVDYGKRQVVPADIRYVVGDQVIVTVSQRPDGVVNVYFVDYVRLPKLGSAVCWRWFSVWRLSSVTFCHTS
jgi:hypothetical protein